MKPGHPFYDPDTGKEVQVDRKAIEGAEDVEETQVDLGVAGTVKSHDLPAGTKVLFFALTSRAYDLWYCFDNSTWRKIATGASYSNDRLNLKSGKKLYLKCLDADNETVDIEIWY